MSKYESRIKDKEFYDKEKKYTQISFIFTF